MSKKKKVLLLLAVVLLTAGLMRAFNVGHTLTYDEAWNANTVSDGATGHTGPTRSVGLAPDNWFGNFYRHPPIYLSAGIAYAYVTGSGRYGASIALEILAIISAILLVYVIFLIGRDWFSDEAGLAAAFLFAVMPAARMLDSLVKAESLTLLFAMLFVLFFFRKKYWLAGLLLGLALLTKEVAIFVPGVLLVFLLLKRKWKELFGLVKSGAFALVACFWWYLFLSSTSGEFSDFFFGKSVESAVWHRSWSYYLGRLPADLGWPLLILTVLGLVLCITVKKNPETAAKEGFEAREYAQFAALALIIIYIALSLSYGKPPWMIYSALPFAALLGGWGLLQAAAYLKGAPAKALVAVALAAALGLSLAVGFGGFMKRSDPRYEVSIKDRQAAVYVNAAAGVKGSMALKLSDLTPTLPFYLDSYRPGSMIKVPQDCGPGDEKVLSRYSMFLLYEDTTVAGLQNVIDCATPAFVLARKRSGATSEPGKPFTAADLQSGVTPLARFGIAFIWSGPSLANWRAPVGP